MTLRGCVPQRCDNLHVWRSSHLRANDTADRSRTTCVRATLGRHSSCSVRMARLAEHEESQHFAATRVRVIPMLVTRSSRVSDSETASRMPVLCANLSMQIINLKFVFEGTPILHAFRNLLVRTSHANGIHWCHTMMVANAALDSLAFVCDEATTLASRNTLKLRINASVALTVGGVASWPRRRAGHFRPGADLPLSCQRYVLTVPVCSVIRPHIHKGSFTITAHPRRVCTATERRPSSVCNRRGHAARATRTRGRKIHVVLESNQRHSGERHCRPRVVICSEMHTQSRHVARSI